MFNVKIQSIDNKVINLKGTQKDLQQASVIVKQYLNKLMESI